MGGFCCRRGGVVLQDCLQPGKVGGMEYAFMEPSDFDPEEWEEEEREAKSKALSRVLSQAASNVELLNNVLAINREKIDECLIASLYWGILPRELEEAGAGIGEQALRDRRKKAFDQIEKPKQKAKKK